MLLLSSDKGLVFSKEVYFRTLIKEMTAMLLFAADQNKRTGGKFENERK